MNHKQRKYLDKMMWIFLFFLFSISNMNAQQIQIQDDKIYGYDQLGNLYQNQFVEIQGDHYYFQEDGSALTSSWKKANGNYYYFGTEGKALKGIHYLGVQYFGFSNEGLRLRGYHEIDHKRYFFNSMGASVRALFDVDDKTLFIYGNGNYARNRFFKKNQHLYVFDQDGYMVKNQMYEASHIQKRDTYKVYCNQDGVILEGFIEYQQQLFHMNLQAEKGYDVGFCEINQKLYYFNEDGHAARSEWIEYEGHRYYFNEQCEAYRNQFVTINDQTYYFNESGIAVTGYLRIEIDNEAKYYYFNEEGASQEGIYNLPNSNTARYFYGDGSIARSEFIEIDHQLYFFTSDGVLCKSNWRNIGKLDLNQASFYIHCDENGVVQQGPTEIVRDGSKAFYYLDLNAEKGYRTGIQEINGKYYGFSFSSGKALKGVKILDDEIYYFQNDHTMYQDGWVELDNHLYYFKEDGKGYLNEIVTINDNPYYFNDLGYVATGYQVITKNNQKQYYFYDEKGISQTGLIAVPNTNYSRYFYGDGTIIRSDFLELNEKLYFFTSDGVLCKSNWRNIGILDLNQTSFYIHCDENGVIQQGPMKITQDGTTAFYYLDLTAEKGYRTGIQEIDGKYYGFSISSGKALKGVKILDDEIYYFQDDHTMYQDGWITISNKHYYFRNDGRGYREELVTILDNPYYFTSSGYVATGYRTFMKDDQKQYYFYDENGISLTGLIAVPNTNYSRYFQGDGKVITSQFYEMEDKLYFFTNSGILFVGDWRNAGKYDLNLDHDLYIHSDENGIIAQGYSEFVRDGKDVVYYFDRHVKYGHRLGLVDCGDKGTFYFKKSQTYGFVAKGIYSDPTVKKTYYFDEETGALQTSGQLNIAGTQLSFPVQADGTLNIQIETNPNDDLRTKFVKLGLNELYKKYTHYSFTAMEHKDLAEIDGYSCSGLVIRLLYELYDRVDYFERNHDLVYQAYCNRENGQDVKVWSKDYPIDQLLAGDLVVINKYDCYNDVDDVGDLSMIDLNGDGICDREHEAFMGNDGKLIHLHVHHIGIYLGDGYYLNSIPSNGVCIQKIPDNTEVLQLSAFARVLPEEVNK